MENELCLYEENRKKGIQDYFQNCKECSKEENYRPFEKQISTEDNDTIRIVDTNNLEQTRVVESCI